MRRVLAGRAGAISTSVFALALLLAAAAMVLGVANGYSATELLAETVGPVAAISFSAVGALVAARRPGNPIGWIFLFVGLMQGLVASTYSYAEYALVTAPGSLPLGPLASWLGQLAWYPALFMLLTYGLLLFPDGRLPGRGWRFVARACAFPLALFAVAATLSWPERGRAFLYEESAQPDTFVFFVEVLLFPLLLVCALVCIASLVVRYRRSGATQRQQLKWFVYAAAATFLVLLLSESLDLDVVSALLLLLVVPTIPAAVGISIFRYRLYDIDAVINRTLVYGLLTVTLALVYLGSVVSLQYAFRTFAGGESQLAVVASTLAIAALFNPLRRRVQAFVDRRFYRDKYDAGTTLAAFSASLRDETDLDRISAEAVEVVRRTLQPAHASLWLVSPHEGSTARGPIG